MTQLTTNYEMVAMRMLVRSNWWCKQSDICKKKVCLAPTAFGIYATLHNLLHLSINFMTAFLLLAAASKKRCVFPCRPLWPVVVKVEPGWVVELTKGAVFPTPSSIP